MTDQDLQTMRKLPLDIEGSITDVNIWHAYKMKIINSLTLLPMSMSSTRIHTDKNSILKGVLEAHNIPIVTKQDLLKQRKSLSKQFQLLQCSTGPVRYSNDCGKTIHLAKVDGHDESSIQRLNVNNRHMLAHVLRRADYHSAIKLVWNKNDHSMVSVVSKSAIKAGTVIVDYGGIHYLGLQLHDSNIGLATESCTWEVLKHPDSSREVLIHPLQESNCGRFINGVREDEQHRVNCAIVKVKDKEGCVHVLVVAFQDIPSGEHLFYYYGDAYLTEWAHGELEDEFMTIAEMTNEIDWEDIPL